MIIFLACMLIIVACFANFIDKLICSDNIKITKIFLVFCYGFLVFAFLYPALLNSSPYVWADYNVSCSKPQDSCVASLKYLQIQTKMKILKNFKNLGKMILKN